MVVLRGIIGVATPPAVSIARVNASRRARAHLSRRHGARRLECRTNRNDFVPRFTPFGAVLCQQTRAVSTTFGNPGHTADQHELFTSRSEIFASFKHALTAESSLNQIVGELLEFRSGSISSECVSDRSHLP